MGVTGPNHQLTRSERSCGKTRSAQVPGAEARTAAPAAAEDSPGRRAGCRRRRGGAGEHLP